MTMRETNNTRRRKESDKDATAEMTGQRGKVTMLADSYIHGDKEMVKKRVMATRIETDTVRRSKQKMKRRKIYFC